MSHTPGPWHSKADKIGVARNYIISGIELVSGEVYVGSVGNGTNAPASMARAQSNARLVAAAPDLLEALKVAESALAIAQSYRPITRSPDGDRIVAALAQTRDAIAKARGAP